MSEFGACTEFVLCLREELAYWEGVTLTGFSITYKEHTCLLIVRVKQAGRPSVSFWESDEMVDCFRALYRAMHTKKAISWQADKFVKK